MTDTIVPTAPPTTFQVRVQRYFARRVTRPTPHRWMYRATGGLIGSRLPGVRPRVLLLTTIGRRTGRRRTTPLVYFELGGQIVIVGTNGGKDQNPHWAANLLAHPEVTIQRGRRTRRVVARKAIGEERAQLWTQIAAIHPLIATYQHDTDRQLPVFVLEDPTWC